MFGAGEGDGGMCVVRGMGKMSSGSSPLPSMDALNGMASVKQVLHQRVIVSTQRYRRELEGDILSLKTCANTQTWLLKVLPNKTGGEQFYVSSRQLYTISYFIIDIQFFSIG